MTTTSLETAEIDLRNGLRIVAKYGDHSRVTPAKIEDLRERVRLLGGDPDRIVLPVAAPRSREPRRHVATSVLIELLPEPIPLMAGLPSVPLDQPRAARVATLGPPTPALIVGRAKGTPWPSSLLAAGLIPSSEATP